MRYRFALIKSKLFLKDTTALLPGERLVNAVAWGNQGNRKFRRTHWENVDNKV